MTFEEWLHDWTSRTREDLEDQDLRMVKSAWEAGYNHYKSHMEFNSSSRND